jgi:LysM repeat protein
MDARRRRELTHYGAPAAFLLVVTIAVLLIKAGLTGNARTTTTELRPTSTATTTSSTTATTTTTAAARYYTIQPGDTLGAIAIREHTSVAALLQLNPGIDPQALHTGQRIRVG